MAKCGYLHLPAHRRSLWFHITQAYFNNYCRMDRGHFVRFGHDRRVAQIVHSSNFQGEYEASRVDDAASDDGRAGTGSEMGKRSPCSPQIHGHKCRSLQLSTRVLLRSYWLADVQETPGGLQTGQESGHERLGK